MHDQGVYMINYLIKRLLYGFLVMLGVITLVFFLFNVLPGDPSRMLLGQRADISSVNTIRKELGLDKPVIIRYASYLNDLSPLSVHSAHPESYWYFDKDKYTSVAADVHITSQTIIALKAPYLRRSYQSKREVTDILYEAFPLTALLAFVSIVFALIVGVVIGIFCALYKDTWFDKSSLIFSVIGMSFPSFFAAVLIAWFFAFVLAPYTGLNMTGSLFAIDDFGNGEYLQLKNLILPALTLGVRPLAIVIELTRNSLLDVMSQDYIRTARAKGLSEYQVIRHHALKNAMNPIVTAMTGWFASLMAGAVFVEYVFDWKGVGVIMVDSLEKYDFPVVMGVVLFIALILVLINIFADLIYSWLDPRVRIN